MREPLYNQRFDDIYFSPEDGLAETKHVFLAGNDLPEKWQRKEHFTIIETGFGTGLNFLAAWQLFSQTAKPEQKLDFISFEKYPLSKQQISDTLDPWSGEFDGKLEAMLVCYPLRVPGYHYLQFGENITLTLIFDDVNEALPLLDVPRGADAWFLDGFAPSKNPEMWSDMLFENMRRLSNADASAATFTVAGFVRRGLEAAGFEVAKAPGFGRKKDMCRAVFKGEKETVARKTPQRVAIIGGGLAGTACAHVLGKSGIKSTIFEKADCLASAASGNAVGLYNPRFFAQRGADADFYSSAYALAVRTLQAAHNIEHHPDGALHLMLTPEKEKRFQSMRENAGWHDDHLQILNKAEASAIAGVELAHDAMYLPDSGSVSPAKLCAYYAEGAEVVCNAAIESLDDARLAGFDAVIVANAHAAGSFEGLSWLPVYPVRGQVTYVKASALSESMKTNLCYGGYFSKSYAGAHALGSTFQKWLDTTEPRREDDEDNFEKLAQTVPDLAQGLRITEARAALRTASKDRLPLIGQAMNEKGEALPNIYLSLAHGSHGILSSLMGAYILCSMLAVRPYSRAFAQTLSAQRFIDRAKKKDSN